METVCPCSVLLGSLRRGLGTCYHLIDALHSSLDSPSVCLAGPREQLPEVLEFLKKVGCRDGHPGIFVDRSTGTNAIIATHRSTGSISSLSTRLHGVSHLARTLVYVAKAILQWILMQRCILSCG